MLQARVVCAVDRVVGEVDAVAKKGKEDANLGNRREVSAEVVEVEIERSKVGCGGEKMWESSAVGITSAATAASCGHHLPRPIWREVTEGVRSVSRRSTARGNGGSAMGEGESWVGDGSAKDGVGEWRGEGERLEAYSQSVLARVRASSFARAYLTSPLCTEPPRRHGSHR